MSFMVSSTQVLPPKAVPAEPELPTWSPSELEGVSIANVPKPDEGSNTPIVESPFEGLLGVVVGLVLMWLKGRLGRR